MSDPPLQVMATLSALQLIDKLRARHGPVMFHQSGGCCDGSSPMCYPDGDFLVGSGDVRLGEVSIEGWSVSRLERRVRTSIT